MTNAAAGSLNELQAKKKEWEEKLKQVDKMINEGTERLGIAVKSGENDDILPYHALFDSGNKLLTECRHEMDQLHKQLESQSG